MHWSSGLRIVVGAIVGLAATASTSANAITQGPVTITQLGAQGIWGYVTFSVPFIEPCGYNNIYFDLTTDAGKAALSVLLTARASGRPITRIDYTKNAAGMCYLDLVQI